MLILKFLDFIEPNLYSVYYCYKILIIQYIFIFIVGFKFELHMALFFFQIIINKYLYIITII